MRNETSPTRKEVITVANTVVLTLQSVYTDEWLATHRFDLDTALRLAREAAPRLTVNGVPATEVMTW